MAENRCTDNLIECAGYTLWSDNVYIRIINDGCGWATYTFKWEDTWNLTAWNIGINGWGSVYTCWPFTLSWNSVSWATSYNVYYDDELLDNTLANNYESDFTPTAWWHVIEFEVVGWAYDGTRGSIVITWDTCPDSIWVTTGAVTWIFATTATWNGTIVLYSQTMSEKGFIIYPFWNAATTIGWAGVVKHIKSPLWSAWAYSLSITGLSTATHYTVRAYAIDAVTWEENYWSPVSFTTV